MAEIMFLERGDQAEGLRRLLGHDRPRCIVLASACAGVGKTSVAINLAAAIAAAGLRVLLIDENYGLSDIASSLGLPRQLPIVYPLKEAAIASRMLPAAHGLTVLPLASAMPPAARNQLWKDLKDIQGRFDVVLVDTAHDCEGALPVGYGSGQEMIVVSTAAAQSITASYALIKRVCVTEERFRIHVMLNRVVGEANAQVMLENLIGVARENLKLPLLSLGSMPSHKSLRIARGGYTPAVAAVPASAPAARYRDIAEAISAWPHLRARPGLMERLMQRLLTRNPPAFASAGV